MIEWPHEPSSWLLSGKFEFRFFNFWSAGRTGTNAHEFCLVSFFPGDLVSIEILSIRERPEQRDDFRRRMVRMAINEVNINRMSAVAVASDDKQENSHPSLAYHQPWCPP